MNAPSLGPRLSMCGAPERSPGHTGTDKRRRARDPSPQVLTEVSLRWFSQSQGCWPLCGCYPSTGVFRTLSRPRSAGGLEGQRSRREAGTKGAPKVLLFPGLQLSGGKTVWSRCPVGMHHGGRLAGNRRWDRASGTTWDQREKKGMPPSPAEMGVFCGPAAGGAAPLDETWTLLCPSVSQMTGREGGGGGLGTLGEGCTHLAAAAGSRGWGPR